MARTTRPVPHELPSGSWRIRWINAHGERDDETYATFDDAQFKLDEHLLEAEQVRRGLRGLSVPDKSFDALCDLWLATRAKAKRSEKDDISVIEKRLRPHFGRYLLRNLTLDLVDAFVAEWSEVNSEKTVNTTSPC